MNALSELCPLRCFCPLQLVQNSGEPFSLQKIPCPLSSRSPWTSGNWSRRKSRAERQFQGDDLPGEVNVMQMFLKGWKHQPVKDLRTVKGRIYNREMAMAAWCAFCSQRYGFTPSKVPRKAFEVPGLVEKPLEHQTLWIEDASLKESRSVRDGRSTSEVLLRGW